MLQLQKIHHNTNFENIIVGQKYFESCSQYYIATCKSKNPELKNNGFNQYYQTAIFDIHSKDGRFIETCEKSFYKNL